MSLFSNLGKHFEKTKQALVANEQTDYVCVSCEKSVDADYEHCPYCGETTIEPAE